MICVARIVTVVILNTSLKKEDPIGPESEITARKSQTYRLISARLPFHCGLSILFIGYRN